MSAFADSDSEQLSACRAELAKTRQHNIDARNLASGFMTQLEQARIELADLRAQLAEAKLRMSVCSGPCHGPGGDEYLKRHATTESDCRTLAGECAAWRGIYEDPSRAIPVLNARAATDASGALARWKESKAADATTTPRL